MFKSALYSSLIVMIFTCSVFGQGQFMEEGESSKGVYAGYFRHHKDDAVSIGLLLAPSNQVGIGLGLSKVKVGSTTALVVGPSVEVWLINEVRKQAPFSLCLFGSYDMTMRRETGFPDWAYAIGASVHKNINFTDQHVLQPYVGMSFQKSELSDDDFLKVYHAGLTFASRTANGGVASITVGWSYFDDETGFSVGLGVLKL